MQQSAERNVAPLGYIILTRNIDVGQVAPEKLVEVGGGYSSNGRELIREAYLVHSYIILVRDDEDDCIIE